MERHAVGRLESAIEHREIVIFEVRSALNGFMLLDIFDDVLDLLDVVAQAAQRARHRIVDDLQ